jgi:hypothetical protein
MKATMSLQLDPDTPLKLIRRLSLLGGTHDLSEAVSAAIEFWLAGQTKMSDGVDPAGVRGYQWKTLFLPEGNMPAGATSGPIHWAARSDAGNRLDRTAAPKIPIQTRGRRF